MNAPDPRNAALAAADAAIARGDLDAALAEIDRAREADPHDEELPLLAATIRLRAGDPARAARLALESIAIRPFHPAALDVLGVALLDARQPRLARAVLRHGVTLAPGLKNLERNLRDADARQKELRRAGVSRDELARARAKLPATEIEALTAARPPRLGACVLVGAGGETTLERCLDSLRPHAEPIVVVRADGAADAEAWRAALRQAQGDWILALDAGERLGAIDDTALRRALTDATRLAWPLVTVDAGGHARLQYRLVRNAAGLRASGWIEPTFEPALRVLAARWGLELGDTPVGRLAAPVAASADTDPPARPSSDDLRARIEDDLEVAPDDPRALLDRAWLDMDRGGHREALDAARRARRTLETTCEAPRAAHLEEATVLLGACLLRAERFEELAKMLDADAASGAAPTANVSYLRGAAARALGENDRAADLFEAALAAADEPSWAPLLAELSGATLPNLLGALHLDAQRVGEARRAFDMALDRDPDNLEARLGLATVRYAEGELEALLGDLDGLVAACGDDPRVWTTGAILLGTIPELADTTVGWLEEALRRRPDDGDLRRRLGEALLRAGEPQRALEAWNAAPVTPGDSDTTVEYAAARITAALCCGSPLPEIDVGETPATARAVAGRVPFWLSRLFAFGALGALDRALVELPRAESTLPGVVELTASWLERAGQDRAAEVLRARVVAP